MRSTTEVEAYWKERAHAAERKLMWIARVYAISSKTLSPAEKLTIIAVELELAGVRHEPDRGQLTTVFEPALAHRVGFSRQTISSNLHKLEEKGVLTRETYFPTDSDGNRKWDSMRVAVGLNEGFLANPAAHLARQTLPERNHGGKRTVAFLCKECSTIGFQISPGYRCTCTSCGTIQFLQADSPMLLTEEQLEEGLDES